MLVMIFHQDPWVISVRTMNPFNPTSLSSVRWKNSWEQRGQVNSGYNVSVSEQLRPKWIDYTFSEESEAVIVSLLPIYPIGHFNYPEATANLQIVVRVTATLTFESCSFFISCSQAFSNEDRWAKNMCKSYYLLIL
jgi:hypothetical protein